MGVVELFFSIVIIVLLGAAAVWVIGYMAPTHPAIIDKAIWLVVVVFVILLLVQAFGLIGHDPQVPRLR